MTHESKLFSWHYGKMLRFLDSAFRAAGTRFGKNGIHVDYAERNIVLSPVLPSRGMSAVALSASPLDEMLSTVLLALRERGQYVLEVFNDPSNDEPVSIMPRNQRVVVTMWDGRIHNMELSLVDGGQPLVMEFTNAMIRTMPRTLSVLKTALTRAYMEANPNAELCIAWSRMGGAESGSEVHPWATPAPRIEIEEN